MDPNAVEILLVEDSQFDSALTIRALKKQNLTNHIHHVKDGAEALNFIFATGAYSDRNVTNGPKVVLLNLKLPKVDGLEVLKEIKSDERTRMIPVVMMTSSKEEADVARSYEFGVNSYIIKPVDFGKFSEAIAHLGLYWLLLNRPMR